jgi:hypothetical protein
MTEPGKRGSERRADPLRVARAVSILPRVIEGYATIPKLLGRSSYQLWVTRRVLQITKCAL